MRIDEQLRLEGMRFIPLVDKKPIQPRWNTVNQYSWDSSAEKLNNLYRQYIYKKRHDSSVASTDRHT